MGFEKLTSVSGPDRNKDVTPVLNKTYVCLAVVCATIGVLLLATDLRVAVGAPKSASGEVVAWDLAGPSTPRIVDMETRDVSFSDRESLAILGEGWETRGNIPFWQKEKWVWATHVVADLEINVLVPRDITVLVDIWSHYLEDMPPQHVTFFWEGHRIQAFSFEETKGWSIEQVALKIPAAIQKPGRNTLSLASRYAVSRYDATGKGDTREAAVGLHRIVLREADAASESEAPLCRVEEAAIKQNRFAAVRAFVDVPDCAGVFLTGSVAGAGRILVREDGVDGPVETVVLEGGDAGPFRLDLSPWQAKLVEIRFESMGGVTAWTAPAVVCAAAAKPAPKTESRAPEPMAPEVKNVVLVVLDALRADALGCYGHLRDTSPFIDSIAAQSLVFSRVYSAATETFASTTSLLTSLYPYVHDVLEHDDRLSNEALLVQYWLGEHDVATGCVSQNPFLSPGTVLGRRFDEYRAVAGDQSRTTEGCRKVTEEALDVAGNLRSKTVLSLRALSAAARAVFHVRRVRGIVYVGPGGRDRGFARMDQCRVQGHEAPRFARRRPAPSSV